MTASFCTVADVLAYLNASLPGTDAPPSPLNTGVIASNIRVASAYLQRTTGRQFEAQATTTKKFTTEGRAYVPIPDLRTATSVSLQGAALTADATYYLIPDQANDGIYLGVQFRAFSAYDWRGNPEWFDRNLDNWRWSSGWGSLPNDLSITGDWGWSTIPDEVWSATRILAAWLTKRSDAVLSNVVQGPGGTLADVSELPPEVAQFIETWRVGEMLVGA